MLLLSCQFKSFASPLSQAYRMVMGVNKYLAVKTVCAIIRNKNWYFTGILLYFPLGFCGLI